MDIFKKREKSKQQQWKKNREKIEICGKFVGPPMGQSSRSIARFDPEDMGVTPVPVFSVSVDSKVGFQLVMTNFLDLLATVKKNFLWNKSILYTIYFSVL